MNFSSNLLKKSVFFVFTFIDSCRMLFILFNIEIIMKTSLFGSFNSKKTKHLQLIPLYNFTKQKVLVDFWAKLSSLKIYVLKAVFSRYLKLGHCYWKIMFIISNVHSFFLPTIPLIKAFSSIFSVYILNIGMQLLKINICKRNREI